MHTDSLQVAAAAAAIQSIHCITVGLREQFTIVHSCCIICCIVYCTNLSATCVLIAPVAVARTRTPEAHAGLRSSRSRGSAANVAKQAAVHGFGGLVEGLPQRPQRGQQLPQSNEWEDWQSKWEQASVTYIVTGKHSVNSNPQIARPTGEQNLSSFRLRKVSVSLFAVRQNTFLMNQGN